MGVLDWLRGRKSSKGAPSPASVHPVRAYDAAARGRGTDGWIATGRSADAEIGIAASTLRARMRDLVRNNPMAANAVQVLVSNIVGSGIRPRANSGDEQLNAVVDRLWEEWHRDCDLHGRTDFHGLTALAVRQMIEGGDCFALRYSDRRRSKFLGMQIGLQEADHLDDGKISNSDQGAIIRNGVEYDQTGRRIAYWLFPYHPGDVQGVRGGRWQSRRIPADRVVHLYEQQRIQSRGVPWGAPAMRALQDLADWQLAELVRKKIEACMVGVVYSDDPGASLEQRALSATMVNALGQRVEKFEPGMIAYVNAATDVKFHQPAAVGGVEEWHRTQLHIIAAGFRVPYALMTGDLSQTNFSSSRVGLNEFRRMIEQLQWHTVIPMFCEPIWRWFIEAAKNDGAIPEDADVRAEWGPPKFESVNPLQDVQADILEVRAGFSTLQQQVARRGYDFDALMKEWREAAAAMDAASLVFDTDPRKVARSGGAQAVETKVDEG